MWLLKRRDDAGKGALNRGAAAARVMTFGESIGLLETRLRALRIPLGAEGAALQESAGAAAGDGRGGLTLRGFWG
jgi:hypothetical protein